MKESIMRHSLAVILLDLILIALVFSQTEMTADEAIRIGLDNNFDIQIARNNLEITENNIGSGTAGFLPTLDATGSFTRASTEQETNSPFSFGDSDTDSRSAQIALSWTLFDGFSMFISRSQLKDLAKASEYQTHQIIENTVVSILRSFFNVVQQELLLEVAQSTAGISKTRLQKEKVRQELGASSTTDFLNAQVAYNDDRVTLMNQELNVEIAKKDLNVILGNEPNLEFGVQKSININPLLQNQDELIELTLKKNNDLKRSEQDILVAQKSIGLSRSSFYPKLFFNAAYGYNDVTTSRAASGTTGNGLAIPDDINSETYSGTVGLTLSFSLFNGFRDRILWQNARLAEKNAQLVHRKLHNSLVGLLREKFTALHNRIELIQLEEQNVNAAEKNLQIQQDRYAIGAASSLEFRDAQVNLARAQSLLITAKYQARITRIEIEQLAGILELN